MELDDTQNENMRLFILFLFSDTFSVQIRTTLDVMDVDTEQWKKRTHTNTLLK